MRRCESRRPGEAAPDILRAVDTQFTPRRYIRKLAFPAARRADGEHAQLARTHMRQRGGHGCRRPIHMAAHGGCHTLRTRIEGHRAHPFDIHAGGFHRMRERGMRGIADHGADAYRIGGGIFAHVIDELARILDRRIGAHYEHDVFNGKNRNRRKIRIVKFAAPGHVVTDHRLRDHLQIMRIALVIGHERQPHRAAATRPVRHRRRLIEQLALLKNALDQPALAILRAARRGADDDVDGFFRLPGLRVAVRQQQR